ncbi:MAG: sugar transferase [Paracoccaceae bacterium]
MSLPLWKRLFDLTLAVVLVILSLPILIGLSIWMVVRRDLPIFYIAERMKTVEKPFQLIKFRTMRVPDMADKNTGVSGGDKSNRITPLGKALRDVRLDELPQLWNVIRGEMSFVGPRPPLRRYTDMFPELYRHVLRTPPGITGLASIMYHKTEARLLAQATTAEETEAIYIARCVPRKAWLDRIYLQKRSLTLDCYILYLTAAKIAPLPGRRARRIRE